MPIVTGTYEIDDAAFGVIDDTGPPDETHAKIMLSFDPLTATGAGVSGIFVMFPQVLHVPPGVDIVSISYTLTGTPFAPGTFWNELDIAEEGTGLGYVHVDAVNTSPDTVTVTYGAYPSPAGGTDISIIVWTETGLTEGDRPSLTGGHFTLEWSTEVASETRWWAGVAGWV